MSFYEDISRQCSYCDKPLAIGTRCIPCISIEVEDKRNKELLAEGRAKRKIRKMRKRWGI